jgi:hypothetical protein
MKNFTILFFAAFALFAVIPVQLQATEDLPTSMSAPEPTEAEVAGILNARLVEIHEMDLKSLTRAEKRALRQEVRSIKSELKDLSGGVYLSVGAILIILLLLILIL